MSCGDVPRPSALVGSALVRGFGLMSGLYKREREDVFDRDGFYHTGDRGYLEHGVKLRWSGTGAGVEYLELDRVPDAD